ncbi:RNA polymeras-like protein II mediator complex component Srb8 [Amylocarpus encephaloides]|uniref:Mediator of RNA polymerase II transcription subunit 12 n=1 Tax=Amylocarpus encephaloides TaxID=45428 RepID=A0A9P7YIH2_9HELO|nr:RNA polymeras-like protein II mediator complex component Srb8 [Amylocarpus encephaloides]
MTTRPPSGQRQSSQRSLSSTNVVQRPSPHRTLSQKFPSPSPTRRATDAFVDATIEGTEVAQGRHGAISRMGGSLLKLEISDGSNGDIVEPPNPATAVTPSRRATGTPHAQSQLSHGASTIHGLSPRDTQEGSPAEAGGVKPMPLPARPGQHAPPNSYAKVARPSTRNNTRKDMRPRPYTLEVPAAAPHYPPRGHVDFFPWTGNQAEDQFSEPVIRQGHFDKAQMTQNETGSARASLFPALKHKSGFQTLSSLFTTVLGQRRAHGQITTASTFKPPPRVTVTDTKREMWLKDLANPAISLRRLSRSIPHGIRGKVLLDHSMSKRIPIERAVWLAKCVGANELRSFRRKGVTGAFVMGGEAKWIKDFTISLEQFVESVTAGCGESDYKFRVNYAIQLAAHFYAERLVDRDHYMDWLVSCLENCAPLKLPIWILVTQIYWKDLLSYRKFGLRLSTALLNHYEETANHPDQDILAPLVDRLRILSKVLLISSPDNFVSPQTWAKHRDIIQSNLLTSSSETTIFKAIEYRNQRLLAAGGEEQLTSRQRLIQLLDTTLSELFSDQLIRKCWRVDQDKSMLLQVVLEWCGSLHRLGLSKIYIAGRLCRFWSSNGADITGALLEFLDSKTCTKQCHGAAIYHLIAELARSEHFSTARYLQWLVARGGLLRTPDFSPDGPCATRLVAELPTHSLTEGILTLHTTLLTRVDFLVDEEQSRKKICMAYMKETLFSVHRVSPSKSKRSSSHCCASDIASLLPQLSRSSKSEIGLWLRQKVRSQMQPKSLSPLNDWEAISRKTSSAVMTMDDFHAVRCYLELLEDHSMLADVLKVVATSGNAEVLASCSDTITLHLDILAAIGALLDLFDTLMARLRDFAEDQDSLPRGFLASLADLADRIPSKANFGRQLSQELALMDKKSAVGASSPVSDHAAALPTAETYTIDEIDKILVSGNSMDHSTLDRLFQKIVSNIESAPWGEASVKQRGYELLLTRLRLFGPQHFDTLLSSWLTRFLRRPDRPSIMIALAPLVSFGCLTLSDIVQCCDLALDGQSSTDEVTRAIIARELVEILLLEPFGNTVQAMREEEIYRLRIMRAHMQKDLPAQIICSIRRGLEQTCSAQHAKSYAIITGILQQSSSLQLLQRCALLQPNLVLRSLILPLLRQKDPQLVQYITTVVDQLLFPKEFHADVSIEATLNAVDVLTLPMCQLKLECMFANEDTAMSCGDEPRSSQLQALEGVVAAAVQSGKTSWVSILPMLEASIVQHLLRGLELQFLALFPSHKSADEDEDDARLVHAENLMHVMNSMSCSKSPVPTPRNSTNLAQEILITLNGVRLRLSASPNSQTTRRLVSTWIPLLISFVAHRAHEFEVSNAGHETRAKAILALSAILLELQLIDMSGSTGVDLMEQVFDLALCLVDSLPDEPRQQCIRTLNENTPSTDMHYLFSFQPSPSEWLVLSQNESSLGIPATPSSDLPDKRTQDKVKLTPLALRRWEMLGEPAPNIGRNDTSLSLSLFAARRG